MPIPRAVAGFNKKVTNRATEHVAGRLPGFGIVFHEGRRSGRAYRTPVNVFRRSGGFEIPSTYGRGDWVRNVVVAGTARLLTRGRMHVIGHPTVIDDPRHEGLPLPVRGILRLVDAEQSLIVDEL